MSCVRSAHIFARKINIKTLWECNEKQHDTNEHYKKEASLYSAETTKKKKLMYKRDNVMLKSWLLAFKLQTEIVLILLFLFYFLLKFTRVQSFFGRVCVCFATFYPFSTSHRKTGTECELHLHESTKHTHTAHSYSIQCSTIRYNVCRRVASKSLHFHKFCLFKTQNQMFAQSQI